MTTPTDSDNDNDSPSTPPPAPKKSKATPLVIALIVGLVLVCGGLSVAGVVAAIAIPNFVAMQNKAKRAEVPSNVDGIKTAQLAYDAAFDEFVPAGPHPVRPEELDENPRSWSREEGFDTLGWGPDGDVRGTYMVEVERGGRDFVVHGWIDADGDGEPAHYTARRSTNAALVTPNDVY